MKTLALFVDYDGTAGRSGNRVFHLIMRILCALDRGQAPTFKQYVLESTPPYAEYLRRHGVKGTDAELRKRIDRIHQSFIKVFGTGLYSDVEPVLKHFKGLGLKICIVTANIEHRLRPHIDCLPIDRLKDLADDKAAVFTGLCAELGIKPEEAIAIGDTCHDVRCARKARTIAVGITRGDETEFEFHRAGADHVVSDFEELKRVVSI